MRNDLIQTQIESDKFGLKVHTNSLSPKNSFLAFESHTVCNHQRSKIGTLRKAPPFFFQFCFVFIFLGNLNQCDCVYIKVDTLILACICAFISFLRSGFCSVDCNNWKSSSFFFFLIWDFWLLGCWESWKRKGKFGFFWVKTDVGFLFFFVFWFNQEWNCTVSNSLFDFFAGWSVDWEEW